MFEVVSKNVENFIVSIQTPLSPLALFIDKNVEATHAACHLQSSYIQAQYLKFFCQLFRPKFVLELGTFMGLGTLALAEGLDSEGEIHSIEADYDSYLQAQNYLVNSSCKNKINLHFGKIIDILPQLSQVWNLIYIDADKANYLNYFSSLLAKSSSPALFIIDNIFFHGKVLEQENNQKKVLAIKNFNNYMINETRFEKILLPIRDGLLVVIKY